MSTRQWEKAVLAALAGLELPDYVSVKFESDWDPDGREVGRVWLEMPSERDDVWSRENRRRLRDAVQNAIFGAEVEPWVYVVFTEKGAAPAVASPLAKAG